MIGQFAIPDAGSYIAPTATCYSMTKLDSSMILDRADTGGNVRLEGSTIAGWAKILGDAVVVESRVADRVEIRGKSTISDCHLEGNLQIGNVTLTSMQTWGTIP